MRKTLSIVALITVVLAAVVLWSVRPTPAEVTAQPQTNCTKTGDNGRNIMSGTDSKDVLCAKGGGDYLSGGKGNDVLRGDKGHDTEVGNKGKDTLKGAGGPDRLVAVDSKGTDTLIGGKGNDQCFADPGDTVKSCEQVFRGGTTQTAIALSNSFNGQGELAESQIVSPTVAPTPPGNTLPPCNSQGVGTPTPCESP